MRSVILDERSVMEVAVWSLWQSVRLEKLKQPRGKEDALGFG